MDLWPCDFRLDGRGKFYDPQGRFVDECTYALEVLNMKAEQVEKDGLPDFITVGINGTITSDQLALYRHLEMPLTLELDDGRFLRFKNPGIPESNSVFGYGFYETQAHDALTDG